MYKTNFDYEPITVFIMGIVGILYFFFKPKEDKKGILSPVKIKNKGSRSSSSSKTDLNQTQNVNVNLSLGSNISQNSNESNIQKEHNQAEDRDLLIDLKKPKTKILFIDDDKNFNVVNILKTSGWKNTKSVVDIKTLDISAVKEADILFVDINGVGKLLNLENEGLDLALMLKQKYPAKRVVIYSANKNNNIFHDAWDICDFKLEKNALPYQFQSLVEKYSLEI